MRSAWVIGKKRRSPAQIGLAFDGRENLLLNCSPEPPALEEWSARQKRKSSDSDPQSSQIPHGKQKCACENKWIQVYASGLPPNRLPRGNPLFEKAREGVLGRVEKGRSEPGLRLWCRLFHRMAESPEPL